MCTIMMEAIYQIAIYQYRITLTFGSLIHPLPEVEPVVPYLLLQFGRSIDTTSI
jgi:hypothetical protein